MQSISQQLGDDLQGAIQERDKSIIIWQESSIFLGNECGERVIDALKVDSPLVKILN